jgi:hypothetical protein
VGELRYLVADAARAAFEDLRAACPGETFYAFALEVGGGAVSASANTEEGLRRTAQRFADAGYGSADALASNERGSLRWRTDDWEHRGADGAHFSDANALVAGGEDPGDVVDELVGALRDLNREDFFGWGPERDAVVVLVLTVDPGDVLELARDVNPAVPFARLQAALG